MARQAQELTQRKSKENITEMIESKRDRIFQDYIHYIYYIKLEEVCVCVYSKWPHI